MPGQLAAAVHRNHRGAVEGALVVLGEFAGGVDGGVFEQQYCAGGLAGDDFFVDFALEVPAACM